MERRIRILPDWEPPEMLWYGWWPEGYSSLGRIAAMSLAQAVAFYLRVLSFTWIIPISLGLNPWQ